MLNSRHISMSLAVLAAIALAPAPASAQGLFDIFFGGTQRPAPPPSASAYADPTQNVGRPSDAGPRVETGPAVSYCVRLCDGRFFPIQRSAATPVEVCNSFCPAAKTKVFSGGGIEHAVAHDGTRYADLANAFVYRTKVVPGCTCNGKDAFGLVNTMKAAEDPTLHQGDVVATADGFVAYSGGGRHGDFTPIEAASSPARISSEARRQLSQTKIMPGSAPASEQVNASAATRDGNDRQAQLSR
jgi:hypothetical protein